MRVTVVGAGVLGLTCAVRLAERGHAVDVLARDLPLETTSAVAGGLWLPYLAEPVEAVARWARATFTVLAAEAQDERTGVRLLPGRLLYRTSVPEPSWARALADVAPLAAVRDPGAGYALAWDATLPLLHTPTYLDRLRGRLMDAGGTLTRLALPALPRQGTVVNCTGLAARALAPDPQVSPVRGQVLVLRDPGLDRWVCEESPGGPLTYVLPRGRDVVVGGTSEAGEWDTTIDPALAREMLVRAVGLEPRLAGAEVLAHRVGLRPARPAVRLEAEDRVGDDGTPQRVVHCYGHGGSGWTLSWGCADDVAALVDDAAA